MVHRHVIMTLLILCLLLGVADAVDLESTLPPPPPPPSISMAATLALLGLGLLLTCIFVPLCLIGFIVGLFVLLKILGVFRVKTTLLIGFLVRRVMTGGLKTVLWWVWLMVSMPAGWFGISTAARIIGTPIPASSRWVFAVAVCISAAAVFVSLSTIIGRQISRRFGGMSGMMKQANVIQAQKLEAQKKKRRR